MKHIFSLLLFLPVLAYAQFPASPNKIRLGNQTTADGLVVRTAASPGWTPSSINNAWLAFDTVAVKLYYYDSGTWNEYTGGSVNIGNTDLTLTGNRRLNTGGYQFWIQDGTGSEVPYIYIGGDQVSFAASTTTSVYLDSSEQRAAIVAGAVIDIDADSIRIIGTQPNDNSLNRILALDSITNRLHYVDKASITGSGGTDTNFATDNLTFTGNRVHNLSTRTLTIADGGTYPTYQQSSATDGITLASSATDLIAQTPGLLQIENSDTITVTADRIRMNAADTRIQQLTNDNALNRLVALDSLTNKLYYIDKASISGGGGGGITGSGTTGTIPVWSSSSALGDSPLTVSSGSVIAGGTGFFRFPVGTTAQRPGTPQSGDARYSSTLGYSEIYGASAWLQSAFPAGTTGQTIRHNGTSWIATSHLYNDGTGVSVGSATIDVDAANGRFYVQNTGGVARQYVIGSTTARIAIWGKSTTGATLNLNSGGTTLPAVSYYIGNQVISSVDLMAFGRRASNFGDPGDGDVMRIDGVNKRVIFGSMTSSLLPSASMHAVSASGDNNTLFLDNVQVGAPTLTNAPSITLRGRPQSGDDPLPYARILAVVENTGNSSTYDGQLRFQTALNGTLTTYATLLSSGNFGIGTTAPARTLHITGEARITDLTTDDPTRIVGADADGDLGAITVSTGLSLSSGNLTADNLYTANGSLTGARTVTLGSNTLTMTGTAGAPAAVNFSMNPSTNTTTFQSLDGSLNNSAMTITPARTQITTTNVTGGTAATYGFFADSVRISPAAVANDDALTRVLAINSSTGKIGYVTKSTINAPSYNFAELTVSGGSTSATAGTPERPDNDTPGTPSSTLVGTFTASGSTLDYTGSSGQGKVSAVISFNTSGGGEVLISIYKEGTEIASTEMREAVNAVYTTVALPTITTALAANDTFEIRIEPVTGSNTITVHRCTLFIEKLY